MKLIKFYSDDCQPCKSYTNTLSAISHPLIFDMHEHDVQNEDKSLLKRYDVRTIPTLVLVEDNGDMVRKLVGNAPKANVLDFLA